MGVFIKVNIDHDKCLGPEKSGACIRVCPVNIFAAQEATTVVLEENEDECILCNLCVEKCTTGAIAIEKCY